MCEGELLALNKFGTLDEVDAITAESAYRAYQELLDKAQIEIIMCGSGEPKTACSEFQRRFAARVRHPIHVDVDICRKLPVQSEKDVTEPMDVKQGKLVLAYRTEIGKTMEERAASRLAVALFGGIPTSLLFTNVREKMSLCYYCQSRLDTVTGMMLVDSGVEADDCKKAQEEIIRQLENLQKGDFEDRLIDETKLFLKTAFRATGDSLGAMESWYLTQALCGSSDSPEDTMLACQTITKEQIVAAASKLKLDTIYRLLPKQEKEAE